MRVLLIASVLLVGVRAQLLLKHGTCTGRCFLANDYSQACQCDYDCETYGNCCQDFWLKCRGNEYGLVVTKQELNNFAQSLWDNDVNRIDSKLYALNTKTVITKADGDKATEKLIVPDGDGGLEAKLADTSTTYPTFIHLLNNYNPDRFKTEVHPDREIKEEVAFWNAISKTKVVNLAFHFLVNQGYLKGDIHAFHTLLNEMWFELYPHNNRSSSKSDSGFEHVIVGETVHSHHPNSTGLLTGFNNWVRFYEEEKRGSLDYMGNIRSSKNPDMVDARFTWHSATSKGASFFVGTSPEFDMSLFTVCAVVFPNKPCSFTINGQHINVRTSSIRHHYLTQITAAYPIVPHNAVIIG